MKVEITAPGVSAGGTKRYAVGDTPDLPDDVAEILVSRGEAKKIAGDKPLPDHVKLKKLKGV